MAKEEIVTKVKEVMNAPSCYSGLKKVCQSYLDAAGTADEEKASALLKKELKEDVNSIDHVFLSLNQKRALHSLAPIPPEIWQRLPMRQRIRA